MRTGMPSSSRTLRTPTCAMPRAKPPPKARPIVGTCMASATALDVRDSSRPKACMDRITLARRFTGPTLLVCRCRKPYIYIYKMPRIPVSATAPLCYVAGYVRIPPALLEFQYLFERVTNSCNPVNLPSVATGRYARFVSPNDPLEPRHTGALRVRLASSRGYRACRQALGANIQ